MYLAPAGVFGAMAAAIAKNGLGILYHFRKICRRVLFWTINIYGLLLLGCWIFIFKT
jgi:Na+/H+-dicarboxylate symporter